VVERSSRTAYQSSGLNPEDIDVFQLHDACAFAELLQYEQVGIAEPGEAAAAVLEGRTGPGGDSPVTTDGGLLSRGHALGATGLAQLSEPIRQLRCEAGARQVPGALNGLSVNSGGWMGDDYATAVATLLVAP
jgi:acetyl-CoA acetyltransferase